MIVGLNLLMQIPSANAGHMACLGPCLLQAPVAVHTLIVHGGSNLESCINSIEASKDTLPN